jgi:HEPN domain-containing protein
MKGDPLNPLDWLTVAKRDLRAFRTLQLSGDIHMAGFCLQQASEKALKGWLIGKGWPLVKTHTLGRLLAEALALGLDLDWFSATAERLTDLYFTDRYVDIAPDPEPTDSELIGLHSDVELLISILFPENS